MVPCSRRRFVGAVPPLLLALAGCLDRSVPGMVDGGDPSTESPTPPEPTRGEADPVTVTARLDGDDAEYLRERDAVRYVSRRSGDDTVHSTISFDQWADARAAAAGARRVASILEGRFDEAVRVGAGRYPGGGSSERGLTVAHSVLYDRRGNVISKTSTPFADLVAAAPRSVTATASLSDREFTATYPVVVVHDEIYKS